MSVGTHLDGITPPTGMVHFHSEGDFCGNLGILDKVCEDTMPNLEGSSVVLSGDTGADICDQFDISSISAEWTYEEQENSETYSAAHNEAACNSSSSFSSSESVVGGFVKEELARDGANEGLKFDQTVKKSDATLDGDLNLFHPLVSGASILGEAKVRHVPLDEYSDASTSTENSFENCNWPRQKVPVQTCESQGSQNSPFFCSGCGRPDLEEYVEEAELDEVTGTPNYWEEDKEDQVYKCESPKLHGNGWLRENKVTLADGDWTLDNTGILGLESKTSLPVGAETKMKRLDIEVSQVSEDKFYTKHGNRNAEDSLLNLLHPLSYKLQLLQKSKEGRQYEKGAKVGELAESCVFPYNEELEDGLEEELGPDEVSRFVEALDVNESYIDTVLDMEDVLLDPLGSGGRILHGTNDSLMTSALQAQDGSLSPSPSDAGAIDVSKSYGAENIPLKIDWIEVVGARQRKGGASIGERMVGVKDHTLYCMKVWSCMRKWDVERRYRDFVDLHHQLKSMFNTQSNMQLPACWEEVEKESRKVFGSSSLNIIEQRSALIEICLQSLLREGSPFNVAPPLFWFLCPTDAGSGKVQKDHGSSQTSVLGKTIGLVVQVHSKKSLKQLLYAQHDSCAGCYKRLDVAKGLVQGFVQTLGWGKPRFCEYSGQLFCASCHLNETVVLPARVLQQWDFTPRRVSQLAKAYLDSIYDQPMLCVGAVNPHLYSRVPILAHVTELRRSLSKLFSCIRCPSRAQMHQILGPQRYLLECNDFFALRDLEDLSKGAFAVLPGLMNIIYEKLKVHITRQCSICRDFGEWCGAGFLCEDPFTPIFPFQDDIVTRCQFCHLVFHNPCFQKCGCCPCKSGGKDKGCV